MSQYKISKKRLAQIIKEEYQSLHEDSALMDRQTPPAEETPAHLTVARMIESGDLDSAIETLTTMREAKAELASNRQDEAAKPDFADLDDDGDKEEPMKKAAKEKNLKKESLDSIRDLIQQELQSL
tara:strand:+ start:18 stop:395 length:378 start_codon:yes stop_codon:yes gene_type:complete